DGNLSAGPRSPRGKNGSRPSSSSSPKTKAPSESKRPSALEMQPLEARLSTASLPLPSPQVAATRPATPVSAGITPRPNDSIRRRHSHHVKGIVNTSDLTTAQKVGMLRQHYFRSQTQFLTALEGISNRLVTVPKP